MKRLKTPILILFFVKSMVAIGQTSTQVVAHRTAWKTGNLPQNSIIGLNRAKTLDCYAAEIDIHLTKDNHIIVTHDRDIQGLEIETSTFKELQSGLGADKKLLTLEDFIMEALNLNILLWLDLKTSKKDPARALDLGHYAALEVERLNATSHIQIIGPEYKALLRVLQVLPDAQVLYTGTDKNPLLLKNQGFQGVFVSHKKISSGQFSIKKAKEAGLKIGVYTVNKKETMEHLLEKDVDYITTDEPEILVQLMRKKDHQKTRF